MYETFYNNSKVELSEAKFNLFYGKRNDRIIKEGIAELQSHIRVISPSNEDDEPETEYHNDKRSIQDRVFSIIIDKLTLEPYEVSMNSNLMSDLGADSLDAVELIMEMEKEFGIIIPDEDAEMIRTVGDIVRYIENIIS
ncbi:acyl carrier protein [Muribaculaceae bacterium Isolate-037 (Harlan)]|uniref:Acyl carrier protein n=1 Tax=Lepagella muris TaxID=3032870 RepID=A0AC61RBM5_9BACT|nr:acyl carrier protein [Muribaculaceae bacterium Isolate-037 (Harlan)]TGY76169.1 acyl carrier protein [Lepagella muris]THG47616.1 acyl carrier protein [Bacteroidales bacterium]TKC66178.1 acyl carrier protein [Bacteroidales bacterium]